MSLLDTASLIVTPNGYKEGKLYSVIPSDGSGDLSVTRATTATRVNSAGLVELVPYNLLSYSEQFDNAFYTKNNSSISANATTAPNGTTTADKLVENSANDVHYINIPANTTPSGTNTLSIYAKADGRDWVWLYLFDGVAGSLFAYFNVANGTLGTVQSGLTANIENVGNGWYRCSVTRTQANAGNGGFGVTNADNVISYTGNGTSGAYIWGAQLNEGTLKDYQKTETRLNIPRLDYSNGTCPSILVEPQRTNLLTYSSSFDNADWGKLNTTISANSAISPSGIQDADTLTASGGTALHTCFWPTSLFGANHTISVYAKKNTNNFLQIYTDFVNTDYANFDLNNGVVGSVGSTVISSSIESVGDGWYRCSFVTGASASQYVNFSIISSATSPRTESNALTTSVFIWGAQLEAGSYATSYIPTTSASVTRNADDIKKTGASSLIGQSEGTIFFDGVLLNKQNQYVNIFNTNKDVTNVSSWSLFWDTTNWQIYFRLYKGNGTYDYSVNLISSQNFYNTQRLKIAVRYKNGDSVMYINGVQQATSSNSYTINGTKSELFIAEPTLYFGYQESTECNSVALWKQGLTNAQLATLTTI